MRVIFRGDIIKIFNWRSDGVFVTFISSPIDVYLIKTEINVTFTPLRRPSLPGSHIILAGRLTAPEAKSDFYQSQPFSWETRDGLRTQQIMLA